MQYEEHYVVTLTTPGGEAISEKYDDAGEATDVYDQAVRMLAKGCKIELHRHSSVMLGSAARAR
ncbi:hypothetical protein [Streptomyces sp. NPDC058280]|uniref:hypothetical protein n=1 Tax=Streptomyces sp. NPDC058280 TaxID=3346419 RepID=UPI0036E7F0B3